MLYFVATPIGNLKDISYRAVEILNSVDVIACEDTRRSLILLNHYGIKKKLISYNKDNEKISANGILKLLESGKNVAIISDSGMPIISDPGAVLVKRLFENDIDYTVVPGANAGLCALLLSGMDASQFMFVGFLPEKNTKRKNLIKNFINLPATLIFYISPHSLSKDITFLATELGNRPACLVNEITKMFEKKYHFCLEEFQEQNIEPKGEYVLIVQGRIACKEKSNNLSIEEQIKIYLNSGYTRKEALKKVAKDNKIDNIYKYLKND